MDEARLTTLIQDELDSSGSGPGLRYQPLADYLQGVSPYGAGVTLYAARLAGGLRFEPRNAAAKAVNVARDRDSAAAGAAWLIKVLAARDARVRLIIEVGGVEVTGRDVKVGAMTLTSPERLPRTPFSERMIATGARDDLYDTGLAYLYQEIDRADLWTPSRPKLDGPDPFQPLRTLASRLAILRDASPVVLRVWSEHLDPDLDELFGAKGWGQPGQDAAAAWYAEEVTPDDEATLARLYALSGSFAKVIDIALGRINLSRRRISPGDQAIDAAIALEALLGDPGSNSDMTYKLRLRTALFLGKTLDARRSFSKDVRALYALRSKVAHGGDPPKGEAYGVAARGVAIVREVLHALIKRSSMPDWAEWELAGGDPDLLAPAVDASVVTS